MSEQQFPTEADCAEVLADVYLFLDHECDQDRRALVQRHLDECGSCLARYGIEQQIKQLLHRKCGGDQAPDELRSRLKASIREQTVRVPGVSVRQTSIEVEQES